MTALPPPGWYPDQEMPGGQRYWDGAHWTPHRAPLPARQTAVAATEPRLHSPMSPARRPAWRAWSTSKVMTAIGVTAVIAFAAGAVGDDSATLTTSTASGAPAARATAPAPATTSENPASATTSTPPTRPSAPAPAAPKPSPKPAPPTKGTAAAGLVAVAGVVDGDTIKVRLAGGTESVRIIGIDTPELRGNECYAQKAASRMQSLVQSKKVRLVADSSQDNRDRYERLLRHVRLEDGRSVAELMIEGGYGREYTYDAAYAGRAAHLAAQSRARAAHRGIWSSGCAVVAPAPVPVAPPPAPPAKPASCQIKGNISSDGEKIYHLPGQQYYDVTKISLAKGERWFCSESDAVNAGWRRSQR